MTPRAGERGQVMVLIALALPVLLGLMGLVLDIGAGYVGKREAQRVADAAVTACATGTAEDTAGERLNYFAQANVVTSHALTGAGWDWDYSHLPDGRPDCAIRVTGEVRTYFLGLVGIDKFHVSAEAEARLHDPAEGATLCAKQYDPHSPDPRERAQYAKCVADYSTGTELTQ